MGRATEVKCTDQIDCSGQGGQMLTVPTGLTCSNFHSFVQRNFLRICPTEFLISRPTHYKIVGRIPLQASFFVVCQLFHECGFSNGLYLKIGNILWAQLHSSERCTITQGLILWFHECDAKMYVVRGGQNTGGKLS